MVSSLFWLCILDPGGILSGRGKSFFSDSLKSRRWAVLGKRWWQNNRGEGINASEERAQRQLSEIQKEQEGESEDNSKQKSTKIGNNEDRIVTEEKKNKSEKLW